MDYTEMECEQMENMGRWHATVAHQRLHLIRNKPFHLK